MKSWELVPLINSSAFHQSDMKSNLCSKKPKCSVMEREEEEIHHPSSDGWRYFSSRDPEKVLCLHRVLKSFAFSNHTEACTVFFSPPGKLCMCITVYFPHTGMAMRSTAGIANRSPSPLCPNRHILVALPQ